MTDQPEALRLADRLDLWGDQNDLLEAAAELRRQHTEIKSLKEELETERVRLAACGAVALANTPETAAKFREMNPEYRSASCDDVAKAVDREMALRAERDALLVDAERYRWLRDGGIALLPYDDHGMGPEFDLTDAAIDAARGKP